MSQSHSHGCEGSKTELVKLYLNTAGQILEGHYILVHLFCRSSVCIQREPTPIEKLLIAPVGTELEQAIWEITVEVRIAGSRRRGELAGLFTAVQLRLVN